MRRILMILTSHRLDCFRLTMDLLLESGDLKGCHKVVLMLNGVEGRHKAYVEGLIASRPDIPWDTVSGPRGKKAFVANLQNEVVRRYPDSLYFKIDEDVFPSPGWMDKLAAVHGAHAEDPKLALVTAAIPNNGLGAHHLLTRFPELGAEYQERFGEEVSSAYNGPVWQRPDIAAWLIRRFIDMRAANQRLAAHPVAPLRFDFRFSINCLVYDERHWRDLGGIPDEEEPAWVQWVADHGKYNVLATDTLSQHYSFFVQQDWLDRDSLLEELRNANLPPPLRVSTPVAWIRRVRRIAPQVPRALRRKWEHLRKNPRP